jgi:hypothetical protein
MACNNTKYEVMARPTTSNSKTGNIPTVSVGTSEKQAIASCKKAGCPMLPSRFGGRNGQVTRKTKYKPCYAWNGTVWVAMKSSYKKINLLREKMGSFPVGYTVADACRRARRSAKCARVTAIGDVSALPAQQWLTEIEQPIINAGLRIYGFTAGWRIAPHLKGKVMASNFSWRQADKAVKKGWRSTCVVSQDVVGEDWSTTEFTSPDGHRAQVCPHQEVHGKAKFTGKPIAREDKVTCNDCQLCVADRSSFGEDDDAPAIIVFVEH